MVIEVHSMKRELSKSLIVFTYIEDQLKFGQTILTSTWWFDLTSLLSLLMQLHTSVHSDPSTAGDR